MPHAARVFLPEAALLAMRSAAESAFPLEACGLLLGRRRQDAVCIETFTPTANEAADPRHGYVVPPLAILAADQRAREEGREIVGIWHSHPAAPALPSQRDCAEAWRGYAYGIHAVTEAGAGELRFFELGADSFEELPLILQEDAAATREAAKGATT